MSKPRQRRPRHSDRSLAVLESMIRELADALRKALVQQHTLDLDELLGSKYLCDLIALIAMHKLLERVSEDGRYPRVETVARLAYDQALAMLAERRQASAP